MAPRKPAGTKWRHYHRMYWHIRWKSTAYFFDPPACMFCRRLECVSVNRRACVLASNTHADYDARPFTRLQCRCTRTCRQRCGACRDCKLRALLLLLLTNCSHDQSRLTARLLNRHWRYNRQAYLMNWWLGSRVVSACWTQAQKGPGSNRSRDAVG